MSCQCKGCETQHYYDRVRNIQVLAHNKEGCTCGGRSSQPSQRITNNNSTNPTAS